MGSGRWNLPTPNASLIHARAWFTSTLGRIYLRIFRWRIEGSFPTEPKCVAVIAPHSSNWDFFLGLALKWGTRLRVSWLGKHTLFRAPLSGLFRRMGGIPVNRSSPQGVVGDCVRAFQQAPAMMLALAPEGTRKAGRVWRSGFYQIALGAQVPILPVAFDYGRRVITFFPVLQPTGDYRADLSRLLALFRDVRPRNP